MPSPREKLPSAPPPVGATFADVILRILGSRFLVVALLLVVATVVVLIVSGVLELSWGDNGVRLSHAPSGALTDINIGGTWRGVGKDLSDSDHKLNAKYTYTLSLTFEQKGSAVALKGSYFINETRDLPERFITGRGTLNGDFLSLPYDIQAGQPPAATTHGVMLFQFHPSSRQGKGYYVTRSMAEDGFVFGSLELSR